jgi:hypothetical protein
MRERLGKRGRGMRERLGKRGRGMRERQRYEGGLVKHTAIDLPTPKVLSKQTEEQPPPILFESSGLNS